MTQYVFPAHAGVIPLQAGLYPPHSCFPRTRGGDPTYTQIKKHTYKFSPHTRG